MTVRTPVRTVLRMQPNPVLRATGLTLAASLAALLVPSALPAAATSSPQAVSALVSVSTSGLPANGASTANSLSTGGRFVAFRSSASNLVSGDSNGKDDVFVRDLLAATTVRVSISSAGAQSTGDSDQPSISADGRFVAFRSAAANLVTGDTNGQPDVFVRDLRLKTTVRVSVQDNGGGQVTGGGSSGPSISDDGTKVAFESAATNVVLFDINGQPDVFVRDLSAGSTDVVTVTSTELPLSVGGSDPSMSGNGRYVVFESGTTQIGSDTNGKKDIFLRDRQAGTSERVSIASNGDPSDGDSSSAVVSDDGRYVAFQSMATDLTSAVDAVGDADVFRRDRTGATTVLISRASGALGAPGSTGGGQPSISADGSKVVFSSDSPNLVTGDTNGSQDVFLRNLTTLTTVRQGVTRTGGQLGPLTFSGGISPDGSATSFVSIATEAFTPDTNQLLDLFVRSTFEQGPFAEANQLLQRSAMDFNGSYLTPAQQQVTTDRVLFGIASPESTIDGYAHGTFDDHRGPVARLYWSFFHRIPDAGGLSYWAKKHAAGTSLRAIANSFAKSSEFQNTYGSLTDTAFVSLVYVNVFERQPDPGGLAHWLGRLQAGVSRGEMMTGFSESSEGVRRMRGEVDTILVSLGMLGRMPTQPEFTVDVGLLENNGGQPTEVIIRGILVSAQYAAHIN